MALTGGIGGVLGAVGTIFQGVMGFASASYQAKVAEMNAEIAAENSRRAIERSQIEQQDQDAQTLAMVGAQEALQGASGLTLTGKSASRVRKTARMLGRKDALNVRQAGEIEKYNYLVDKANFQADAQASRMAGMGSLLGSFFEAGTSLVGRSSGYAGSTFRPRPIPRPGLVT